MMMDRLSSPVRAFTPHRPSMASRRNDDDSNSNVDMMHRGNESSISSTSSGIRPSPRALGLATLISLHNHPAGGSSSALQYASDEEVEQINVFLQDRLFFPSPPQHGHNEEHLGSFLCDLYDHLQYPTTITDAEESPPSIPHQMIRWFTTACSSLDAFFDFCMTVTNPSSTIVASSPAAHASAAALWQRSVGQALQGSSDVSSSSHSAEGGASLRTSSSSTTSFVRLTKLYGVVRTQLREATLLLEEKMQQESNQKLPAAVPSDDDANATTPAIASTLLVSTATAPHNDDTHHHLPSWNHFIRQLQSKERVGATEALHAYMDHHGESLGTAGFLQVGIATHFGASTAIARREAERVVQQHPGGGGGGGANSNTGATSNANNTSGAGATAAATTTTPIIGGGGVVDSMSIAAQQAKLQHGMTDDDDDNAIGMRMPTTPAERYAAGINQALATIYGPPSTADDGTTTQQQPPRRYRQALQILEDREATDDLAYYLLQHERAVRQCLWSKADDWMAALESSPALPHDDSPHQRDVVSQKAFGLAYRGEWRAATQLLKRSQQAASAADIINKSNKGPSSLIQLQLAEIYVYARQYTAALPPILQHLADHPHDAPGLILLATIQLEFLDDPVRACQLVRAALPVALQTAHVAWQAQAYWVLARCCCNSGSTTAQVAMARERAIQLFESLDDTHRLCDIWNHTARFYHGQNEVHKRDQAAAEWLRLRQQQEQQQQEAS